MTITTEAGTPTIEHVAPDALTIEDNVREAVELPKEFVASIKQHGVLVPVRAVRLADGTLAVRDGQRRVLAARDAGVGVVPAYVVDVGDERARVLQQLVTNDQRDALTEHDRVRGYADLALAGMSATAIAKATGTKKARVDQAIAVAGSEVALAATASMGLTLDVAAALVEFEGDEAVQERILSELQRNPGGGEWIVKRIREERARDALVAEHTAILRDSGVRVLAVDELDSATPLWDLAEKGAEQSNGIRPGLDAEAHVACPGHAVRVYLPYGDEPRTMEYCIEPSLHMPRYGKPKGQDTAAEKAERREVVARNKAWDVAEPVRREWLAEFVQRKTLPKDATAFAARVLVAQALDVDAYRSRDLVKALVPAAVEANPTHALVALAIAITEGPTSRETWRTPRAGDAAYFTQLETWGYPLSDVERVVAESGAGS